MADPQQTSNERLAEQQAAFNKEALKSKEILDGLKSLSQGMIDELKKGGQYSKDLADQLKGIPSDVTKAAKNARDLNTALGQGQDITKELNKEILSSGKRIEELEFQRQVNLNKLAKARKDADIEALLRANRAIDAQLKGENLVRKQLELLEQHIEKEKDIAEEKKKSDSITELAKKKLKEINATYFSTLGILKFIIDAGLRFNKVSVEAGKSLGYGADQANRVTQNLASAANNSGNLNFTLKNAAEAMNDLNTATGGVAEYSANTLATQIMLTKQFGLTGEEAAGIYKFAVLSGKASSQINDEMVGAFVSTRNMVKGSADFRKTIAEAAKVSGQLAINFKNNPAEITKAVVQAQILGTTLENAKNQSQQLLEFESSIENELKAELLTGQQMNLERARAAALQGDQVTVMKELANQGMTLNKFQNMNVLAQESFAKALGLSADQLSDQLRKQKIAQEQGKSLAQLTKEEALEAEKRQDIQSKFNAAIEKLQDLIGNLVAGPVGSLLELLISLADNAGVMYTLLAATATLMGGKMLISLGRTIAQLGVALGLSTARAAAEVTAAEALTLGAATIGIIAGVAAVMGALSYLLTPKKVGDLALSPGKGPIISTAENGIFQGTKNDEIAMFPGAVSMARNRGGSPTINLNPVVESNKQVVAAINSMSNRLANKDTSINMDSKTVGRILTQTSTKLP
jgi:hypothetical protein